MIIDSHCHLTYEPMSNSLSETIDRARQDGVKYILTISTEDKSYNKIINIITKHKCVFGTYGIHPHEAKKHKEIKLKDMIGILEGRLGDDDYSEPLEILINSANNHNKFNLYGAFAFKNQLKDRLKMRSRLNDFMQNKVLPSPADPIFVTGLPRSGTVSYTHLTLPTKA